jgi:hypothetical protein
MEWIRCSATRQSGRKRAAETAEPPSSRGCSPPLNSRIIIYKKDYKKDYKKLHHHQVGAKWLAFFIGIVLIIGIVFIGIILSGFVFCGMHDDFLFMVECLEMGGKKIPNILISTPRQCAKRSYLQRTQEFNDIARCIFIKLSH